MQIGQTINLLANILLTVGVTMFMIFIYGRSTMIDSLHTFEKMLIKVALAMTACGSLLNVLTLANPSFSEIIFNSGLAIVFVWAAWFHFKYFVKK